LPGKLTDGGLMFDHVPTASVGVAPVGPPSPPSAGHVGGTKGVEGVEIDPLDAEPGDAEPEETALDEPLAPVAFAPESFEVPEDAPESAVEGPSLEGEGVPESELEVGVRAGTAEDGSLPQPAIKETNIDARTAEFMMLDLSTVNIALATLVVTFRPRERRAG
jgi:hypothetical protein